MKKFTSILLAVMILISCFSVVNASAVEYNEVEDNNVIAELNDSYYLCYNYLPSPPWMKAFYVQYDNYIFINHNCNGESGHGFYVKKDNQNLMLSEAFAKGITNIEEVVSIINSKEISPISTKIIYTSMDKVGIEALFPEYDFSDCCPIIINTSSFETTTQIPEEDCLKIIQNKYGKDVTKCEIYGTLCDYKICFAGAAPDGNYIFTALYYWKSLGNYTFISFAQACPYDLGVFVVDSDNAYTLDDAYNNEIINDDDLKYIVEDVFCNSSYCWSAYVSGADIAPIAPAPDPTESNENSSQTETTKPQETTSENTTNTTESVTVEVTENNTETVPANVTDSTDVTEPETIGTTEPTESVTDDKPVLSAPKTTIALAKSSATLYLKDKIKIKANVKNSTEKTTYTSSDTKVAAVDSKGNVKAKKAGKAVITVTNNGVTKKFTVNVKNPKLNKNTVTVKKNDTVTVKIIGKIKGVNNTYINTKRAKITSGKSASTLTIKGLKKGNTTLKIKVSGITLKLKVKVK
ncbi:MAG: Ig-like domain-containing protein [Ruminococcus sp.]